MELKDLKERKIEALLFKQQGLMLMLEFYVFSSAVCCLAVLAYLGIAEAYLYFFLVLIVGIILHIVFDRFDKKYQAEIFRLQHEIGF